MSVLWQVLLAQSKLRTLVISYGLIAVSILALQAVSAASGWGLLGVWGVYFFFQVSRVALFSWRSGILRLYTPAIRSLRMPAMGREGIQVAARRGSAVCDDCEIRA